LPCTSITPGEGAHTHVSIIHLRRARPGRGERRRGLHPAVPAERSRVDLRAPPGPRRGRRRARVRPAQGWGRDAGLSRPRAGGCMSARRARDRPQRGRTRGDAVWCPARAAPRGDPPTRAAAPAHAEAACHGREKHAKAFVRRRGERPVSGGMAAALAFLPIALGGVLLVGFRVPAKHAMPAAYAATVLIALTAWNMSGARVAAASLQGLFLTFDLLFIIFGAILLLHTLERSGGVAAIRRSFAGVSKIGRAA